MVEVSSEDKNKIINKVRNDTNKIEKVIVNGNENDLKDIHIEMAGKYEAYLPDFGKGMYSYSPEYGFNYEYISDETLRHNLKIMKAKLEGYIQNLPFTCNNEPNGSSVSILNSIANSNSNSISLNLTFKQAKQNMDNMPGLNNSETEELKAKIDELEEISKGKITKKKKWEKVRPILKFAIDKGADVAIQFMLLVFQMKLGN